MNFMLVRGCAFLLFFAAAVTCSPEQLTVFEKGKQSSAQRVSGKVVSFKGETLTFHTSVSSPALKVAGAQVQLEQTFVAGQYEISLVFDEEPIPGSVDRDITTIEMSYPSTTKEVDNQHLMTDRPDQPRLGPQYGNQKIKRDLRSCKGRGEDKLTPKTGPIVLGTVIEISTAGHNGYVQFQAKGAKSPQKYRFNEVTAVVIGACS